MTLTPIDQGVEYREIPLSRGLVALVDVEDFLRINRFKWYARFDRRGLIYAVRGIGNCIGEKRGIECMHRVVLGIGAHDPHIVDHRDRNNTLDNRRSNLRIIDRIGNARNSRRRSDNSTGFKGVSFNKISGKYFAYINVQGRQINLGLHLTPEQAHAAYCEAAVRLHGEFARFA